MTVYESDLPGVGKKFEIELGDDERLVVVIHNTGKREVFRRHGDEDATKLFELSDRLARQVGSILEGAYFQPVSMETTETMLDENTIIEWMTVGEDTDVAGRTLADVDFRNRTGATVVAIQRENEVTESNPGPETTVHAGDTLIVLGERDACQTVESIVSGTGDGDLGGLEETDTDTDADDA